MMAWPRGELAEGGQTLGSLEGTSSGGPRAGVATARGLAEQQQEQ